MQIQRECRVTFGEALLAKYTRAELKPYLSEADEKDDLRAVSIG